MRFKLANTKVILSLVIPISCFVFSLFTFQYYTGGDQLFYREYYQNVNGYAWTEAFQYYRQALGSSEPGYFLITYLLANVIYKDMLMSITNGVLVFLLVRRLMAMKVKLFIITILLLNFYLLVIMFSAERLKLSLLFFLLAYQTPSYVRNALLSISVLTHLQVVLLVVVTQIREVFCVLKFLCIEKIIALYVKLFIILALGGLVGYYFQDHIIYKFQVYNSNFGGWAAVVKPLIFFVLTIFHARNKPVTALGCSVLLVAAFFVGSERITILSYFVFMYYALQYKGGVNFWVLVTSIYFFVKGVMFLYSAYIFGDGFVVNVPYLLKGLEECRCLKVWFY